MAESVGNVSLTPRTGRSESGSVSELPVVLIAFDGVQPIDIVGPHEVFASAGDTLGRPASPRAVPG
jgi:putative intracellular protease/amidase